MINHCLWRCNVDLTWVKWLGSGLFGSQLSTSPGPFTHVSTANFACSTSSPAVPPADIRFDDSPGLLSVRNQPHTCYRGEILDLRVLKFTAAAESKVRYASILAKLAYHGLAVSTIPEPCQQGLDRTAMGRHRICF